MNNKQAAEIFCNAIRTLANKPDNIDNLESYLSYHFNVWLEKFAYNPECITTELHHFATMEI